VTGRRRCPAVRYTDIYAMAKSASSKGRQNRLPHPSYCPILTPLRKR
jgi:hypothetical protein